MKETYRLIEKRTVNEYFGEVCLYEHVKTGARVFTFKNDDKNKVFLIGFRTTPKDSTGVAHIMEHSVLCGSEKYPIKDPFVELAKGSLNTFLNAMTYPDKTVYPVASVNDKDFCNLMDVYLDAVFHPNIKKEEKIFRQEGWHYELAEGSDLSINGVVYNEMKGVYSNPDSVLERYTMHALFPDTTYGFESGGDPEDIPKLTYEDFMAFHDAYYHPSNSYIYLYGDMDMDEKLSWIDENYLSKYEKREVNSAIALQKPFSEHRYEKEYYAVSEGSSMEKKSYLSENFVINTERTQEMSLAMQVIDFLLLGSTGALLEEALIKAGIGEEIYGGTVAELSQPFFSVVAKNADEKDTERFRTIIKDVFKDVAENGFNKKSVEAAVNSLEFKYREQDYGRLPKGLALGLSIFDSWLYDDTPFAYISYEDAFTSLKEKIKEGFLEKTVERYLLNNDFSATVIISPDENVQKNKDEALKEALSCKLSAMTDADKKRLIEETKELKEYQSRTDDEEALKTLPVLKISDISKEIEPVIASLKDNIIYSPYKTNGIAYITLLNDLSWANEDEVQMAAFISGLLGEMNTKKHSYRDLTDEVLLETGGMETDTIAYRVKDTYQGMLETNCRILTEKIEKAMDLAFEILKETDFSDEERVIEKLLEEKSHTRESLDGASHTAAVRRAYSYVNGCARFDDLTRGVAYYDFINVSCRLIKEPVHRKRFFKSLNAVYKKMCDSDFYAAVTGDEGQFEKLKAVLANRKDINLCAPVLDESELKKKELRPAGHLNEGLLTNSQVNYSACTGNFKEKGFKGTGAFNVLKNMLSYDYLWTNVRVLGGAYGCMCSFDRTGKMSFVSYRDPKITETYETYEKIPEYLRTKEFTETEIRKSIIGAIASMDQPNTASMKALENLAMFYVGLKDEHIRKTREDVLSCTADDLRALADPIEAVLSQNNICTIGNDAQIKKVQEETEKFGSLRELYGKD